jgi:ribosome-associated protein
MTRETNAAEKLPVTLDNRMLTALTAMSEKKATDIIVLNIGSVASFTEFFIICSGSSSRQVQAISHEVTDKLREQKARPLHIEGEKNAEWVLMDYGDIVIHVFTESARKFYDLERLWRDAETVPLPESIVQA